MSNTSTKEMCNDRKAYAAPTIHLVMLQRQQQLLGSSGGGPNATFMSDPTIG
ncbi:MAG: hypothetical protein K5683_06355 [Prevotella sp.]|nr:hypothetical protein [Prevotella sp.]